MKKSVLFILTVVVFVYCLLVSASAATKQNYYYSKYVQAYTNSLGESTTNTVSRKLNSAGDLLSEKVTYVSGKTKKVTNYAYKYDDSGNLVSQSSSKSTGVSWSVTRTFDKNGNVTKLVDKQSEPDYSCTVTSKFTYNKSGRVTKKTESTVYGSGDSASQTTVYTYRNDGTLSESEKIETESYGGTVTETKVYDSKERLTKDTIKDIDSYGHITTDVTNKTYSESGKLVKLTYKNVYDGKTVWSYSDTYKYDSRDNVTQHAYKCTYEDGTTDSYNTVYKYNSSGLPVSETYSITGKKRMQTTSYTYDKSGRLVTKKIGADIYKIVSSDATAYTYNTKGSVTKSVNTVKYYDGCSHSETDDRVYNKKNCMVSRTNKYTDSEGFWGKDVFTYTNAAVGTKKAMYSDESFEYRYKDSFSYTGKAIKPKLLIMSNANEAGNNILSQGVDFVLTYSSNTKSGKGKITVHFIGNYEYMEDVVLYFRILSDKTTGIAVAERCITLTWNKTKGASYYKVEKSADGKKWSTAGIASTNKLTVGGLTAGKTYYFRVTALDSEKQKCGEVSDVIKFKV